MEEINHFSRLPNEIFQRIFRKLPLKDIISLCRVCKKWNEVLQSDIIWNSFLPCCSGIQEIEADSAKARFKKVWNRSVKIGSERWFRNPLLELKEYEDMFREIEQQHYSRRFLESFSVLMIRLNPCYDFCELDLENNEMLQKAMRCIYYQWVGDEPDEEDEESHSYDWERRI